MLLSERVALLLLLVFNVRSLRAAFRESRISNFSYFWCAISMHYFQRGKNFYLILFLTRDLYVLLSESALFLLPLLARSLSLLLLESHDCYSVWRWWKGCKDKKDKKENHDCFSRLCQATGLLNDVSWSRQWSKMPGPKCVNRAFTQQVTLDCPRDLQCVI